MGGGRHGGRVRKEYYERINLKTLPERLTHKLVNVFKLYESGDRTRNVAGNHPTINAVPSDDGFSELKRPVRVISSRVNVEPVSFSTLVNKHTSPRDTW